jgi:hypothetical protein
MRSARDRLDIVLVNRFYPPDAAPTGKYLHDVARGLVALGARVRVVASARDYGRGPSHHGPPTLDGVRVTRIPCLAPRRGGRAPELLEIAWFSFAALALLVSAGRRALLVVAFRSPPWIVLVARWAALATGAAHAHCIMDLYPDAIIAHRPVGRRARELLGSLTRRMLHGARGVIAPGDIVARRIARYLAPSAVRPLPVPLWATGKAAQEELGLHIRRDRGWTGQGLVLMYSGNMGRGHSFGEFLAASERDGTEGRLWIFAGDGPRRGEIERHVAERGSDRVRLLAAVPPADVAAHILAADVLLASLAPGWEGVIVPSKVQAIMAAGRPVLFVGRETSEPARWIAASGGGWVVAPGDVEGVCRAVGSASDPAERLRRGTLAQAYAARHFTLANRDLVARVIANWACPAAASP